MSFQNFVLYPKRSLENVIYFSEQNDQTQVSQNYSETWNKTIMFSNPELEEIAIESTRNLEFNNQTT